MPLALVSHGYFASTSISFIVKILASTSASTLANALVSCPTWYADLPDATKNDWDLLQATFHVQYPPSACIQKMTAEYENKLMGKVLVEKDLGVKVEKAGEEKWSHVAWAEDILRIARLAGVANSNTAGSS